MNAYMNKQTNKIFAYMQKVDSMDLFSCKPENIKEFYIFEM